MVNPLRGPSGDPSLRTRALAALVIVGLILLTAPIVLVPVFSALFRAAF